MLKPTRNKDLVLNVPHVLAAMTGVYQARQDINKKVTLIYTDGSNESANVDEYISEDINFFELVRKIQNHRAD